tara:strand:- start:111 stop:515 length:405 start_codon:yes stop_codon:yes gene_type:complete
MAKKLSRKSLIKKLDTIFSQYIRLKSADKKGYVSCYTCGIKKYWEKDYMQNGHFISRRHMILRYSEKNCRPQCYGCNVRGGGKQYQFAINLNKEYGYNIAEKLLHESRKTAKFSNDELVSLINRYEEFVKLMKI